jgi:hypothetical protein
LFESASHQIQNANWPRLGLDAPLVLNTTCSEFLGCAAAGSAANKPTAAVAPIRASRRDSLGIGMWDSSFPRSGESGQKPPPPP